VNQTAVAKAIEECAELLVVLGKIQGGGKPPKGYTDMTRALEDEVADVQAALRTLIEVEVLDQKAIEDRAGVKYRKMLRRAGGSPYHP
jgi:hypothetical protein